MLLILPEKSPSTGRKSTGKSVWETRGVYPLPVALIDEPFMNVQTDRLILATSTGLVQCLRTSSLRWPLVLNADEDALPQAVKTPTKTPVPGDAAEPMPPAGGEADPFAAPAAEEPEAMPAEGAEPDPFAAP